MSTMKVDYFALPELQQMRLRFLLAQRVTTTAGLTPVKGQPLGWESAAGMSVAPKSQEPAKLTAETMSFLRVAIDDSAADLGYPSQKTTRQPEQQGTDDMIPQPSEQSPSTIAAIKAVQKNSMLGWLFGPAKPAAKSAPEPAQPATAKLRSADRPSPYIPIVAEDKVLPRMAVRTQLAQSAAPKKIVTPVPKAAPKGVKAAQTELGSIADKPLRSSEIPTRIIDPATAASLATSTIAPTELQSATAGKRRTVRPKLRVLKWVGDPV